MMQNVTTVIDPITGEAAAVKEGCLATSVKKTVNTRPAKVTIGTNGSVSVGTTSSEVLAACEGRVALYARVTGSYRVYLFFSNDGAATNQHFPIEPGAPFLFDPVPECAVQGIADAGSTIVFLELKVDA
jgi:hypothetical protein